MTTTRVTTFTYDFRGRRIATDGEVDFYEKTTYDNLDRVGRNRSPGRRFPPVFDDFLLRSVCIPANVFEAICQFN